MLRPGSKLADAVAEIEAKLLEGAGGQAVAQRARWAALVRQLGDDSFAQREAADRELRAGGPAALAYLRHLDFGRLDAEQRFRIRRILEAAAAQTGDDSPEQAAASLAGDPLVWLALLDRPERATRQAAAAPTRLAAGRADRRRPRRRPRYAKGEAGATPPADRREWFVVPASAGCPKRTEWLYSRLKPELRTRGEEGSKEAWGGGGEVARVGGWPAGVSGASGLGNGVGKVVAACRTWTSTPGSVRQRSRNALGRGHCGRGAGGADGRGQGRRAGPADDPAWIRTASRG